MKERWGKRVDDDVYLDFVMLVPARGLCALAEISGRGATLFR